VQASEANVAKKKSKKVSRSKASKRPPLELVQVTWPPGSSPSLDDQLIATFDANRHIFGNAFVDRAIAGTRNLRLLNDLFREQFKSQSIQFPPGGTVPLP
jgi:hypothetical protein